MSRSYSDFKNEIKEYIFDNFNKESTILDVGPGIGTYYDLLKDKFQKIDCVEIFKKNIEIFNLNDKYRKVYNQNIKDYKYEYYDLIIMGDIIEHLNIKDATQVLKYALNKCKEIIVAVPYEYSQGIEEGNIYEVHIQDDLTEEIMKKRYPYLKLLYGNSKYGYFIKGGLNEIINNNSSL